MNLEMERFFRKLGSFMQDFFWEMNLGVFDLSYDIFMVLYCEDFDYCI
jgi:hypothetical protein